MDVASTVSRQEVALSGSGPVHAVTFFLNDIRGHRGHPYFFMTRSELDHVRRIVVSRVGYTINKRSIYGN